MILTKFYLCNKVYLERICVGTDVGDCEDTVTRI